MGELNDVGRDLSRAFLCVRRHGTSFKYPDIMAVSWNLYSHLVVLGLVFREFAQMMGSRFGFVLLYVHTEKPNDLAKLTVFQKRVSCHASHVLKLKQPDLALTR